MTILSEKEKLKVKHRLIEIELEQEKELEAQRLYKEKNKIEFFSPFPYQQRALDFIFKGMKTILFHGANQIGKTILGTNIAGMFSLGYCPWVKTMEEPIDKENWIQLNSIWYLKSPLGCNKPIIGRILCNDWEKAARDTIVPKLKEWLPEGLYETRKNNIGVDHEFIFPKTGSKFTILTYKEDTKSHEGWTGNWVWADEPPPKDKYISNRRGLVANNGVFIMTLTALDQPWILDDIATVPDRTTGMVTDIPIRANPTLTEEAIRIFEKDIPDNEKIARIEGGWMQLIGRIWKVFDVNKHTCEPFKIPPDWPCEFQIDFHLNLPHAILFYTCDQYGRYFYFNEIWQNMSTEEIADEIIRVKEKYILRMKYGEIDALSKGDTSYIKNRFGIAEDSFTIINRKLRQYGISLGVGSKDEKSYIRAVEDKLKGPNNEPLIKIFNNCQETIKQTKRWSYDDNGVPNSDGHFPECIGRSTQTGLKYTRPQKFMEKIKYAPIGV